jgi:hypothetical protein
VKPLSKATSNLIEKEVEILGRLRGALAPLSYLPPLLLGEGDKGGEVDKQSKYV